LSQKIVFLHPLFLILSANNANGQRAHAINFYPTIDKLHVIMKHKAPLIIAACSILFVVTLSSLWIWSLGVKTEIAGFSNTAAAITANYQRKTFYANGYHWIFYSNGTHILYTNSRDGSNWNPPAVVRTGISSSGMSIWYDGNMSVSYAYASGIPGDPVVYRAGLVTNDEIRWGPEQTVSAGKNDHEYYNGFCTIDSLGNHWVSYIDDYNGNRSSYAVKAASKDGATWSDPVRIAEPIYMATYWRTSLLPLNNGEVYAILASQIRVKGRLWNGNAWQEEETITTKGLQQDFGYSAISDNGDVHLVLLESQTYNILYFKRTSGQGWENSVSVQENQDASSLPILTMDKSTHRLYCFWVYNNIIYMKRTVNASWENQASTSFGTSFDTLRVISSFYYVWDGKIGVARLERPDPKVESFILKYDYVEVS